MIIALVGLTCELSPGALDFLQSQIPTPMLAFALLLYWGGTRRFKTTASTTAGRNFWRDNAPTWMAYVFATVSMGVGLFFYALSV